MKSVVWWPWCVVLLLAGSFQAAIGAAAEEVGQPAALDLEAAKWEVAEKYAGAHPEVQEYILWTARSFGPGGLWLNEDAFAGLSAVEREKKVLYLAVLLEDGEYGRHLCEGLAQAGAIEDERLVPGLMKVAGYHQEGVDYDCRAKWMAVAALAREESDEAVPLLVSLVDHLNQNTRMWARAALCARAGRISSRTSRLGRSGGRERSRRRRAEGGRRKEAPHPLDNSRPLPHMVDLRPGG